MAGCSTVSCFWALALVGLVALGPRVWAEIQCNDAVSQVLPCEAYLLSGEAQPNAACCAAVQSLDKMVMSSTGDRRAICQCFKGIANSLPVNLDKAQRLPNLCHVTVTVKIDPNVNCDR
ncbi:Non-specific lipid-transfer protein 8 [Striga hermonthica]|uniref:Non-specific lipid-transfer protein n=1 Tax=Striga hermonthica TaxID=68872 RepID=A0A9N7NCX5_STRHE|nr:Non-specific lipid-transfer protein 8 [Striga hermonthica]